jgi:hypothetical protein
MFMTLNALDRMFEPTDSSVSWAQDFAFLTRKVTDAWI